MVNEDILTALRNAINHGESLEAAIDTIINSGYNPREVKETANFIGYDATAYVQQKSDEHLTMPSQKNIAGNMVRKPVQPQQGSFKPPQTHFNPAYPRTQQQQTQFRPQSQQFQKINIQQSHIQQNPNAIKQNISSGRILPLSQPSTQPYPQPSAPPQPPRQIGYASTYPNLSTAQQANYPRKSYAKEIILLIILLLLLGILISTIIFRDDVLKYIQGLQS